MVNQVVVDQHAEEAAFLWTQRGEAVVSPQYKLRHLARLDERVEAHLDGLRVAGSAGWNTALAQVEGGPGEVFAASSIAFETGNPEQVNKVIELGHSDPALTRGVISALGWMQSDSAVREAKKLIAAHDPEVRRSGIAGMAIQRVDPGPVLVIAIQDPNSRLAGRSMRAAAELGRNDLVPTMLGRLSDSDETCRFWAAWSVIRLGKQSLEALDVLRTVSDGGGPLATRAVDLVVRTMAVKESHTWRRQLARRSSRLSVLAGGAIGDPSVIPELIVQMQDPELARLAGYAFSLITGIDLSYEDLDEDAPQSARE